MNPIQTPERSAHRLFVWGVAVTVAYTSALAIYSFVEWSHMKAMKPDEFATFLSGAFAPLAFLWLVLGFRQQGDELQNSARALWLQGEELRNSVEQQRQLVEVSREQLNSEKAAQERANAEAIAAAQPQLMFASRGGTLTSEWSHNNYVLTSAGRACSDVLVRRDGEAWFEAGYLQSGQEIVTQLARPTLNPSPVTVDVEYTDLLGVRRSQRFVIPVVEKAGFDGGPGMGNPRKVGEPVVL